MKKIVVIVLFVFLSLPVFSEPVVNATDVLINEFKPLEVGLTFDWISKTQMQRDENIKEIQNILFSNETVVKYSKKEFKSLYSQFLKEKDYLNLYEDISNGKKEDDKRFYCGFYVGKLLVAYGIQYKDNMKNVYYYDAMGNLRWVDVFSSQYPKFPYWSYQYYRNGEMVAAYYYLSEFDQYVFDSNKNFKGRWYKDKLYNKKAKVIMTRTNY